MTDKERQNAYRRLFDLCLWPIEYGAEYDLEEIARTLAPMEIRILTEELERYAEILRCRDLPDFEWPTEL